MRFYVAVADYDYPNAWNEQGSVLLPWKASDHCIEAALAGVGVYAPRGLDSADWIDGVGCLVFEAGGELIVRLLVKESEFRQGVRG